MATPTTNIVNTLGAGSGIDIKSLADNLVEAERAPRKDRIDTKIKQTEARISGYGALKYSLSQLKSAFEKINDASEFASVKASNTQASAFGITTDATAGTGSYSIQVNQIATEQRTASSVFQQRNSPINGGNAFKLSLSVGGGQATEIPVAADQTTPAGVVSAINSAKLGVTAQLLNTGSGYQIVLSGQTGQANRFTMSATATDANNVVSTVPLFSDTPLQTAADASLTVNGLAITRASNSVNDVIDGVTLNLYTQTTGTARLDLNRETGTIKDNLKALVTAYNEFSDNLKILGDRKSTVDTYGGSLAGDSLLESVRSQVRRLITDPPTAGGSTIQAARNVGLSIDRNGVLQLDEAKLDSALQDHFDETVKMFTAGTSNKSVYSAMDGSLAGDAVRKLDSMLRSSGVIDQQTTSAQKQVSAYQTDLQRLQDQMDKLLTRYMNQFSAMESIVGSTNSLKSSLKSSFDGMMASYTK